MVPDNKPEMITPKIWINQLTFSDGTQVDLAENDIVVIVGPNNAGKSSALSEIYSSIRTGGPGSVLSKIVLEKNGSSIQLIDWMERTCVKTQQGNEEHFKGTNFSANSNQIEHWWRQENSIYELRAFFCSHADTSSRLSLTLPAGNTVDVTKDALSHPFHYLFKDDSLETRLHDAFKDAFGQDLLVHRLAGGIIPLYIGKKPLLSGNEDRVSSSFLQRVHQQMQRLEKQGDGMRGFVGVLLNTIVQPFSILLMDEPSVFLHPPQARILGKAIIENAPANTQIFFATHDGEFLRGLLDTNSERIKVIRLRRDGDVNYASALKNDLVRELWSNSLLRYSNILDGLFHERVVVCESDSDAMFYAAVLDATLEKPGRKIDCMFVHGGGMGRIPLLVDALRNLNVPIAVITDIDLLNDKNLLKRIYKSLGGQWLEVADSWMDLHKELIVLFPNGSMNDFKRDMETILAKEQEGYLSPTTRRSLNQLIRKYGMWRGLKKSGIEAVTSASTKAKLINFLEQMARVNLFVLPIGELESFDSSISDHGPGWVAKALKRDLADPLIFSAAKQFVYETLNNMNLIK